MRLNQITVPTLDVDRSIIFYKKLGFELIVHTHSDYARFVIPSDQFSFSLSRVDDLPLGKGIHIYFEVANLDKTVAALEKEGIQFESRPEKKSWLWTEAHLKDPDGNHLVIYHAGENRLNPPWRLKK